MTYTIPSGHNARLPWRVDPETPRQILDADGVPVAWGVTTTSVKSRSDDGREVTYNTTETVGPIRAEMIVAAVNATFGECDD